MLTRRDALVKTLKYLVTGGSLTIAWGYVKGVGPTLRRVSFSNVPKVSEVFFRNGVYLVGLEKGPAAFADKCPHLGCKVDYRPDSEHFRCPCHGSEFAIDGRRTKGPAKMDMTALDVRSSDGGCGECCVELVLS